MLIKELGKQPFEISEPYTAIDSSGGLHYEYSFTTDDGKRIGVFFYYNPRINDQESKYQMSFDDTTVGFLGIQWNAKRKQKIKNNPGSVRILSTILNVLKDFLIRMQPNVVWFAGASTRHIEFYRRALPKLKEELSKMNYYVEEQSTRFYVTKLHSLSNEQMLQ